MKRIIALVLGIMMLTGSLALTGAAAQPEEYAGDAIPEPYSLAEDETGEERVSGAWRYALRKTDGLAVITGCKEKDEAISVPMMIDGYDVIGIGSGALEGRRSVQLHGNILWIAKDAFGKDRPQITALNGTYGLYWADQHGFAYTTGRDYELKPGVIDYTDAMDGCVQRRGNEYVAFRKLEAKRLSEGCLIWFRDGRGRDYFYQVETLTEEDDSVLARVAKAEIAETIVNYENTITVTMADATATPAEGVTLEEPKPATRTISKIPEKQTKSFSVPVSYKAKNDVVYSGDVGISTDVAITYTVHITDGKIDKAEMEKVTEQSQYFNLKVSKKTKVLEMSPMPDEDGNLTEEQKSIIQRMNKGFQITENSTTGGYSFKDHKEFRKYINTLQELNWDGKGTINLSKYMGGIVIQNPWFNVTISATVELNLSGEATLTHTTTNVTKSHYDTARDEWVVDYSNGNASSSEDKTTLEAEIKGSFAGVVEISIGVLFLKDLSLELKGGVELTAGICWNIGNQYVFPCMEVKVDPFLEINVNAGVWIGSSTGIKTPVLHRHWTAKELGLNIGIDHHFNFGGNNGVPFSHKAEDCPFAKNLTVRYDTKTDIQVQPKNILRNGKLNKDFNITPTDPEMDSVSLEHSRYGTFEGWAYTPYDTTPTAIAAKKEDFSNVTISGVLEDLHVRKDLTLYAVWSGMVPVHFDSNGGTAIPDEPVPVGGYIVPPEDPVLEGCTFGAWLTEQNVAWDMEQNTVAGEMTLTADYINKDPEQGGTGAGWIIGDYDAVSADCKFDPHSGGQSADIYFEYSIIEVPETHAKAICIDKVKSSAVHIVIPTHLPSPEALDDTLLPVADISRYAFGNCPNLKSVHFLTGNYPQFSTKYLFRNCTKLEYVELPALENGELQEEAFLGTTNLKCVKFRSGLKKIGEKAFNGSGIGGVVNPVPGIESIGVGAFSYSNITGIDYSHSDITEIRDNTFYGCIKLESIEFGDKITTLGITCFNNCTALKKVYVPDNACNWTAYQDKAPFNGCTALEEFSVGGMDTIPRYLMRTNSKQMRKITIRGSVRKIGENAFYSMYYGNYNHPCELVIEEGVTAIGSNAFQGDSMLTSVSLPTTLDNIGGYAFSGCTQIGSLDLEGRGTAIGGSAFNGCTGLTSVMLKGVSEVGDGAFAECSALNHVDLGEDLIKLGYRAFYKCTSLKDIYLPDSIAQWGERIFDYCTGIERVSVGGAGTASGLSISSPELRQVVIRGSVRNMTDSIGYNTADLTNLHECELIVEEGVESISGIWGAFTKMKFPSTIKEISNFNNLTRLKNLRISGHGIRITGGAFSNCSELETVILEGVAEISGGCFSNCPKLTTVELGEELKSIDINSFTNASIRKLKIPDTLENTKALALTRQTELEELNIGGMETLQSWTNNTNSKKLRRVTVRGSVKTLDYNSFSGNLVNSDWNGECELILEEGVTTVRSSTLSNNKVFTLISIPSTVTTIAYGAFGLDKQLKDVIIYSEHLTTLSGIYGSRDITYHITSKNQALIDECEAWHYNYDIIDDFPHELELNPNNGQASVKRMTAWRGQMDLTPPAWDGHTFSGWYYDAECTQLCRMDTMPGYDLTLYAGWDRNVYTLTVYGNGGTPFRATYETAEGTKAEIPEPTRAGYIFNGWYLDADGVWAFDGQMMDRDTQIYASWTKKAEHGKYRIENGSATLIGYTETEGESSELYLPGTVDGVPLTKIEKGALDGSSAIILHIPATVTEIETAAFTGNRTLKKFIVDEDNPVYRSINGTIYSKDGSRLLFFPPAAREISVPRNVTEIGASAFEGSLLYVVEMPETLTRIGDRAFKGTEIEEFRIPALVEYVGTAAFAECRNLYLINADGNPAVMGENALNGCAGFLRVYGPKAECPLKTRTNQAGGLYNPHILTIDIINNTTERHYLVAGTPLMLPENPYVGPGQVFTGWYTDSYNQVPLTLTEMPDEDLYIRSGNVDYLTYKRGTNSEYVTALKVTGCNALENYVIISSKTYPVYAIAAGAFDERYNEITLPDSIEQIEDGAFAAGTKLICTEGSYAAQWAASHGFECETARWRLHFETNYDIEVEDAFYATGAAIQLPELNRSGYEISGWYWNEEMTQAQAAGEEPVMKAGGATLYAKWRETDATLAETADNLLWELSDNGLTITGYKGTQDTVAIPATLHGIPVTAIGEYALAMTGPVTVQVPDSVTSIGKRAFFGMRRLQAIRLPATLTELPEEVLANCYGLTSITLPEGITEIKSKALANTAIKTLRIPAGVTGIHADALTGCHELANITVAAGNEWFSAPEGVLYDADGILVRYPAAKTGYSYQVRENTWTIGAHAFEGAAALEQVQIGNVYSIEEGAFENCTGLGGMPALGTYIDRIPDNCFRNCRSITRISIPETIGQIGKNAFSGTGLESVVIPDTVYSILDNAFDLNVVVYGSATCAAREWAEGREMIFLLTGTPDITALAFGQAEMTLKAGQHMELGLTVTPADASRATIQYACSNPNLAMITDDGILYALDGGTVMVYASAGEVSSSCKVIITADAAQIRLEPISERVAVGNTMTLTPVFIPASTTDRTLTWTSSNESIATVDGNGVVTAVSEGSAEITARSVNGMEARSVIRAVIPAEGVSLDETSMTAYTGSSYTLTATLSPENASQQKLKWFSSNSQYATVSSQGVVTCLQKGTVTITVKTEEGLTAQCQMQIKDPLTKVQFSPDGIFTGQVGNTRQIYVYLTPSSGYTGSFISDRENVATVTAGGLVSYVSDGLAILRYVPDGVPEMTKRIFIFVGNGKAMQVNLPTATQTIEEEAFCNTGAECIIVPNSVTTIGKRAFADSSKLMLVILPENVEIAPDAFEGSTNVTLAAPYKYAGSSIETYAKTHGIPFVWSE